MRYVYYFSYLSVAYKLNALLLFHPEGRNSLCACCLLLSLFCTMCEFMELIDMGYSDLSPAYTTAVLDSGLFVSSCPRQVNSRTFCISGIHVTAVPVLFPAMESLGLSNVGE